MAKNDGAAAEQAEGSRRDNRRNKHRLNQALSPSARRTLDTNSQRQCRICRRNSEMRDLLALAQPDPAQKSRHIYVCISSSCFSALAKAQPKEPPFLAALAIMAERRLTEAVGLARRVGAVTTGSTRLSMLLADGRAGWVAAASDTAERTLRQLGDDARRLPLNQERLGAALGLAPVAALAVQHGRHAHQAAYWLRVWYEAQPGDIRPRAQARHNTPNADDGIEVAR